MTASQRLPLKSIHGRRCLSKCYAKGTKYLHPVLLTGIIDPVTSCAVYPFYSKEPDFEGLKVTDACRLEDNKIHHPPQELESLLLSFHFNPYDFLTVVYNLNSFGEVIKWTLENDFLPFDTIKRVHNCAWKAFGNKPEELSNIVIEYYYDLAQKRWLKDYVSVIENLYSFELITQKKNITDISKEIYNIVASKFFSYNFFFATVKKYIYENQNRWDAIQSYYGELKNFVLKQLLEHIKEELK